MFGEEGQLRLSAAAMGHFDVREDEEQHAKQVACVDLLKSAGYHRAKLNGLDVFDKIVGGMVWCISLCTRRVDVDILYSENSTIGQKIATTERIVEVLPEVGCPSSLEPHQIQGLDCIHIFPVLEWLVKEASFVRSKRGDEQENFSLYQFVQKGWRVENDTDEGVRPMVKSKRKVYRRVIRMGDVKGMAGAHPTGQGGRLKEKGSTSAIQQPGVSDEADLIICNNGYYVVGGEKPQSPRISSAELTDKLATLGGRLADLDIEVEREEEKLKALTGTADELRSQVALHDEVLGSVEPSQLERVKNLLVERDEIKASESTFKRECRKQLEELDREIERLESAAATNNGQQTIDIEGENLRKDEEKKALISDVHMKAKELKALERDIYVMERRFESQPSQIELHQYQKRFVELYNQMANKHVELKKQYNSYNTLLDVKEFMKREIELLNNIDDSRQTASKEGYRESFVTNCQRIAKSIDDNLDKMLSKKKALHDQKEALAERLQAIHDRRRLYNKMVAELQEECLRSDELQAMLKERNAPH